MNHNKRNTEQGQVLVLIALGLVALLGFTALAIDGSMMYSDRRFGQNAADASSLAGGGEIGTAWEFANVSSKSFSCAVGSDTINEVQTALADAIQRAADNGFTISQIDAADVNDDSVNYVTYECTSSGSAKFVDVIVELEVESQTSFVHFVYNGPVVQRVRSVTRVRPRKFLALGNAVVALNPTGCSGQSEGTGMHGNTQVQINGGGVWSNGCMRVDGTAGDIHIPDGCISFFDCTPGSGCEDIMDVDAACFEYPAGEQIGADDYTLDEEPDCGTADVAGDDIVWVNLTLTGNAYNTQLAKMVFDTSKDTPFTISGLYCIWGDLSMTNGHDKMVGVDVTLYFKGGSLKNTGGTVDIRAVPIDRDPPYTGHAIPGVVIYNDATTPNPTTDPPSCQIDISGNADNRVEGVILAPGCDVKLVGNNSLDAHHSQLIGWNVEVGGGAETYVLFDEDKAISWPTYIDLWR